MSPTLLLVVMICFLAYLVWRAIYYFRKQRPQFGIAVVFVGCIIVYEIVRLIISMASGEA